MSTAFGTRSGPTGREGLDIVAAEIRGIVPALLPVLEPRSRKIAPDPVGEELEQPPEPPKSPNKPVEEDASRLLAAASAAFARWYVELKDVISRGRVIQEKYREEHNLHKNSKAPWTMPEITEKNVVVAESMCAVVRAMFGNEVADYCAAGFTRGTETGDLRSFKIRLLLLKCRDSLKGTPLHSSFVSGVDKAISDAETAAGCIQYTGPRRMSKAEQEASRKRLPDQDNSPEPTASPRRRRRGKEKAEVPDSPRAAETMADAKLLADMLGDINIGDGISLPQEQEGQVRMEMEAELAMAPSKNAEDVHSRMEAPDPIEVRANAEPTDEDLSKLDKEAEAELAEIARAGEKEVRASILSDVEARAVSDDGSIDDDMVVAEMSSGAITPAQALLLMMQHPGKKGKPSKKTSRKPKYLDVNKLTEEILQNERAGACHEEYLEDEEDREEAFDDIDEEDDAEDVEDVEDAEGADGADEIRGSSSSCADDDDDDDEEDEPKRRRRRNRSYAELDFSDAGRRRNYGGYGRYNASGSEWDPYGD